LLCQLFKTNLWVFFMSFVHIDGGTIHQFVE
jgi:hypothetical protein